MAIIINNTEKVIEDANSLISNSEKMNEISSSITKILNELAPLWESSQSDAISYNTNLRKNQELVNAISSCNSEFSTAMVNYINIVNDLSKKTVGGTNGNN